MTKFYVSTTGSASAAGTEAAPVNTVTQGIARAKAGDTVIVRAGTYAEAVTIGKSLTLTGEAGAILKPPSSAWNGITIAASNVTIEGLEIAGAKGDGIEGNGVHHITVRGCKVHGCGESGIQTNYSDWVTIEGNECWGNARDTWASGISTYQNRNIATGTLVDGFRNVIRGNICHDNVTLPAGGPHTDGNGIIIDDYQSTQTAGFPNYNFPTLVENNLCYGNGGKGIQVTWSVTLSDQVTWIPLPPLP